MLSCMYLKEKFNMYQDIENIKYVDCSHKWTKPLKLEFTEQEKVKFEEFASSTNSLKESYAKYWIFPLNH